MGELLPVSSSLRNLEARRLWPQNRSAVPGSDVSTELGREVARQLLVSDFCAGTHTPTHPKDRGNGEGPGSASAAPGEMPPSLRT